MFKIIIPTIILLMEGNMHQINVNSYGIHAGWLIGISFINSVRVSVLSVYAFAALKFAL